MRKYRLTEDRSKENPWDYVLMKCQAGKAGMSDMKFTKHGLFLRLSCKCLDGWNMKEFLLGCSVKRFEFQESGT